jgi:glutamine synthetase
MTIINHPDMTVDDLITVSMYYEANKKKIKQQRLAKQCYQYINQFIDNEIKGKAIVESILNDYHKIKFINASYEDKKKFVNWIKMFSCNKVKLTNYDKKKFCEFNDNTLFINYK